MIRIKFSEEQIAELNYERYRHPHPNDIKILVI